MDTIAVFKKMREFTGISEGRLAVDLETVSVIFIDDKGAAIFGYNPEEIIGEKLLMLFPPSVVSKMGEVATELHIQEAAQSITGSLLLPREREGSRRDGTVVTVNIKQTLMKVGTRTYTFAFFDEVKKATDIKEVKSEVSKEIKDIEAKLKYADLAVNLVAANPMRTIKFISLALLAVPVFIAWQIAINFDNYAQKLIERAAESKVKQIEARTKELESQKTPSPSPRSGRTDRSSP
jgi:PAS domain S-box-containing protein